MFASPAIVLGLIVPADRMAPETIRFRGDRAISLKPLFPAAVIISLPAMQWYYAHLPVESILARQHAAALRELGAMTRSRGIVWTWWDYGYATQYFSGLQTFADGGRNTGEYLFTLGKVLGSEHPTLSANLMSYAAAQEYRPWRQWERWGAGRLAAWFDDLRKADQPTPRPEEPQFLIVQWEAISFLPWIQYYGSWDLNALEGRGGQVITVPQPLELDLESGRFLTREGRTYYLVSADLLDETGRKHYDYSGNPAGFHALTNMRSGQVYLLDDRAYQSLMVQMLMAPAESFPPTGPFRLRLDRIPDVRVFELR